MLNYTRNVRIFDNFEFEEKNILMHHIKARKKVKAGLSAQETTIMLIKKPYDVLSPCRSHFDPSPNVLLFITPDSAI